LHPVTIAHDLRHRTQPSSPDPRRLADWYVETLGFVINFRVPNSPILSEGPEQPMIEIIPSPGPAVKPADRSGHPPHGAGGNHFPSAYETLKARGQF
jgi:hypothetical protein